MEFCPVGYLNINKITINSLYGTSAKTVILLSVSWVQPHKACVYAENMQSEDMPSTWSSSAQQLNDFQIGSKLQAGIRTEPEVGQDRTGWRFQTAHGEKELFQIKVSEHIQGIVLLPWSKLGLVLSVTSLTRPLSLSSVRSHRPKHIKYGRLWSLHV